MIRLKEQRFCSTTNIQNDTSYKLFVKKKIIESKETSTHFYYKRIEHMFLFIFSFLQLLLLPVTVAFMVIFVKVPFIISMPAARIHEISVGMQARLTPVFCVLVFLQEKALL